MFLSSPFSLSSSSFLGVSLLLSAENLCFWQACEDVRHGETAKILEKVDEVYKYDLNMLSMQQC